MFSREALTVELIEAVAPSPSLVHHKCSVGGFSFRLLQSCGMISSNGFHGFKPRYWNKFARHFTEYIILLSFSKLPLKVVGNEN
jgi:hypothetical protein